MFAIIIKEVGGLMKRIIILFSVFLLVGCTNSLSSTLTYESSIMTVVKEEKIANTNGKGFKYYKPRDFSLLEDNIYNHVLLNKGNKYFVNIDINGYYSKHKEDYDVNSDVYYSYKFYFNDINGFVEIKEGNNNYFYIKMMYNYSNIEVSVKENEIKEAIINSAVILSSIQYNDKVISHLISTGDLNSKETTYEIAKPPKDESNKNILDYNYGKYEE